MKRKVKFTRYFIPMMLLTILAVILYGCGSGGGMGGGASTGSNSDGTQNGRVSAPVITPAGGSYTKAQSITLTTETRNATIYYTTDGSDPLTAGMPYKSPIALLKSKTIKAIARSSGYSDSTIVEEQFSFPANTTPATATELLPTTYEGIVLNSTDWYKISLKQGDILRLNVIFSSGSPVLQLFDAHDNLVTSSTSGSSTSARISYNVKAAEDFTFSVSEGKSVKEKINYSMSVFTNAEGQVASPLFSPNEGQYSFPLTVTLTSSTEGADIFYTTDGSPPTASSTLYSNPIPITVPCTMKAFAVKSGLTDSSISSVVYTQLIEPSPTPAPTSSPSSGSGGGGGGSSGGGGTPPEPPEPTEPPEPPIPPGVTAVYGYVQNSAGDEIPDAQVSLDYELKDAKTRKAEKDQQHYVTYTNEHGYYCFLNIEPGTYSITAKHIDYSPATDTVTAISSQSVEKDMILHWRVNTTGITYTKATFIDSSIGWIISDGMLLHTVDAGANWYQQQTPPKKDENTVRKIHFPDAQNGVILDSSTLYGNDIYMTNDGGENWSVASQGLPYKNFQQIWFFDLTTGIAVEGYQNQKIHLTEDGGKTWTLKATATGNLSDSLFFSDSLHGWIVGASIIMRTSDGGRTWTQSNTGISDWHTGIYFLADAQHGWLCTMYGNIYYSENGGTTWTQQFSNGSVGFNSIFFKDINNGWAVGNSIYHTTDGGAHWTSQAQGAYLSSISAADSDHAIGVGGNGKVLYTSNGGNTWNTKFLGIASNGAEFVNVHFCDANNGCVVGTYAHFYTTDGGVTWTSLPCDSFYGSQVTGVYCQSPGNIWIAGYMPQGGLMHTTDWGQNWTVPYADGCCYDICFPDKLHGWVSGWNVMARTEDGGSTWKEIFRSTDSYQFYSISVIKAGTSYHCFTVGRYSDPWGSYYDIYRSKDNGDTWTPLNVKSFGNGIDGVGQVYFTDESYGWCTAWATRNGARYGVIMRTVDGGDTWSELYSSEYYNLNCVKFIDRNHGWIAGSYGLILYTSDSGQTWSVQSAKTGIPIRTIHIINSLDLWAVGPFGTILHATDRP